MFHLARGKTKQAPPERAGPSTLLGTGAQKGRAPEAIRVEQSRTMATVARGEQAERFRALAAKHEVTLAKLPVRMMDAFEACQP